METAIVGRKKKAEPNRKPVAITIKGDPEWRAWVERGAVHALTDVAKLMDAAVTGHLKGMGFTEKPPRRLP
jgi:hypothetical protein